jgi:hypothetical protein
LGGGAGVMVDSDPRKIHQRMKLETFQSSSLFNSSFQPKTSSDFPDSTYSPCTSKATPPPHKSHYQPKNYLKLG